MPHAGVACPEPLITEAATFTGSGFPLVSWIEELDLMSCKHFTVPGTYGQSCKIGYSHTYTCPPTYIHLICSEKEKESEKHLFFFFCFPPNETATSKTVKNFMPDFPNGARLSDLKEVGSNYSVFFLNSSLKSGKHYRNVVFQGRGRGWACTNTRSSISAQ